MNADRRLESVTAELLELYEEITVLHTIAGIAAREADLAGAGPQILDEAVALLGADVGFIHYTGEDLRTEEPEPVGLDSQACRDLAGLVEAALDPATGSIVVAPFRAAASIPRAPWSRPASRRS